MIKNVGTTERKIRIVLGVVLLLAGYFGGFPLWGSVVAYLLGLVGVITGAISYCPISQVLGINTSESGPPKKA